MEVTAPNKEMGGIEFGGSGSGAPHITFITGTLDYGQGHASPFAQILSQRLGVPFEHPAPPERLRPARVRRRHHGGSRSAMMGGSAAIQAAELVIKKGRALAAEALEAAEADIEFREGRFTVVGTDRSISLLELAEKKPKALDVTHVTEVIPRRSPTAAMCARSRSTRRRAWSRWCATAR